MTQARIVDLRAGKEQVAQCGQARKMLHPSVRDSRIHESESLQVDHLPEVLHANIADLRRSA